MPLRIRVPAIAAPSSGAPYTLTADGATYSYSGNDANLLYNRRLVAEGVAYSYLGNDANLFFNRQTQIGGGIYSYSGNDANLLYNRRLVAEGAAYAYSGNDANLVYAPAQAYTLTALGGIYNYSGNNATLIYSGGPPPVIEVIGVCGPQVTNVFLFNGVVEPPFPVQRRTS